MGLFREEALAGRRRTLHGEVMVCQPRVTKILTVCLLLLMAAVFVAGSFVSFARRETAPGWIAPRGGLADAYAQPGSVVLSLGVRVGDTVRAGQALATVSSETYDAKGAVGERQLLQITNQMHEIRSQIAASRERYESALAGARSKLGTASSSVESLKSQKRLQEAQLALARSQFDRAAPLVQRGFISRFDQDHRQQAILALEQAIGTINQQIEAQQGQIAALRIEIRDAGARLAIEESQMRASHAGLGGEEATISSRSGATLRAPRGGIVVAVNIRPGETAKPGVPLVSIAPKGLLAAELLLPTRASGFIRPGQVVRLSVDAFPAQRYGMLTGVVEQIHRAAVNPKDYNAPIAFEEPSYVVLVKLDRQGLGTDARMLALSPGMTVSASLPADRRTIWQWLFDPLLAAGRSLGE